MQVSHLIIKPCQVEDKKRQTEGTATGNTKSFILGSDNTVFVEKVRMQSTCWPKRVKKQDRPGGKDVVWYKLIHAERRSAQCCAFRPSSSYKA